MGLAYHKAKPTSLVDAGLDERWLQDRILEDPSILGLGDLAVIQRERKQSKGGKIDFLMSDPETNTMFEVEVMLGSTDESHIIRTVEYWDIERRRWPNRDHRAVIVAEEITNRFFNVISLLNHAVPIIAIQLGALQIDEKIVLHFTKVLDVYEAPVEEESEAEPADRGYWEKRSNPDSLRVVDQCINLVKADGRAPRITFNKYHIAMGGVRQNFCWFHPRKEKSHCPIELKTGELNRATISSQLENSGVNVSNANDPSTIKLNLTLRQIKEHEDILRDVLRSIGQDIGGGFN